MTTTIPLRPAFIEDVLHRLEELYTDARRHLPNDWNSRRRFDLVLHRLDRQSSPGWPLCREASTIGAWLFGDNLVPIPFKADLLWRMVQDVFDGNYDHHFKIFIKMEAHTKKKAEEGRWRLIMASSLPVQIAWHMAIGHLEQSLLEQSGRHPSAYGQVYTAGGWKQFLHRVRVKRLNWCIDKSAWDWNSPGWVYQVCRELRKRLTVNSNDEWEKILDWLYADAYENSKVILSSGDVYQQEIPGLMKSGLVCTISDNSFAQVAMHVAAELILRTGPTNIEATGDDTIQEEQKDPTAYLGTLQALGCIVKEAERGVHFMGFSITSAGIEPMYVGKHIANLKYQVDCYLAQTLEAYCCMYVHDVEMTKFWRAVASELEIPLASKAYFTYMMDNPAAQDTYSDSKPWFSDRVMDGAEPQNIG